MDEMFDCWTVAKNPYDYHLYFKEWNIRDTTDTVMPTAIIPALSVVGGQRDPRHAEAGGCDTDSEGAGRDLPPERSDAARDPGAVPSQREPRLRGRLADLLDVVGRTTANPRYWQPMRKADAQDHCTENGHERGNWTPLRDHPEYAGQFCGVDRLPGRVGPLAHHRLRLRPAAVHRAAARTRLRARELVVHHSDGGHGSAHRRRPRRAHRSGYANANQHRPVRGSRSTTRRRPRAGGAAPR